MRTLRILIVGVGLVLFSATLASAQATRTWVSGVGDDVNPCSRTAPCKTWAGAISKTIGGGEMNALDPGGYGALTLVKSMHVINEGTLAGTTGAGTNAFIINAPGIHVVLRGLDIDGVGTGLDGIRFLAGASLTIENCRIYGFTGQGLEVTNTVAAGGKVFIKDTVFSGNTGGGILVSGPVNVTMDNVRIERNGGDGVHVDSGKTTVRNSVAVGNTGHGFAAGGTGTINVHDTVSSENGGSGVNSAGATAIVRISNATITGNANGAIASGGASLISYGNNSVTANTTSDGAPTLTITLK